MKSQSLVIGLCCKPVIWQSLSFTRRNRPAGAHVGNAHRGQFEGGSIKFLALPQSLFQSRASLQDLLGIDVRGAIALENRLIKKRFVMADAVQGRQQVSGNDDFTTYPRAPALKACRIISEEIVLAENENF